MQVATTIWTNLSSSLVPRPENQIFRMGLGKRLISRHAYNEVITNQIWLLTKI